MAEHGNNPQEQRKVAERLVRLFSKRPELRITCLATFIPEVVASDKDTRDLAINALRFVIGLAKQLRSMHCGHDPSIVELVCGSRVEGMWYGINLEADDSALVLRQRDRHIATILSDEQAMSSLRSSLADLVADARAANVRLAMELEPGLLFTLRDIETLLNLIGSPVFQENSDVLGLNLDIAHWFLAGIDPKDKRLQLIWPHVIHAHISDHSLGHFGDVELELFHKRCFFYEWLKAFQDELLRRKGEAYVSLEMEACKNTGSISNSFQCLESILIKRCE